MKRSQKREAFSLLEVLFSVTFLILVGLGVVALNIASLRLIVDAELKTTAFGLNDESIAYLAAISANSNQTSFDALINSCTITSTNPAAVCYLNCPIDTTKPCGLQSAPAVIQLGRAKTKYTLPIRITKNQNSNPTTYLVHAQVSWGSGPNKQVTTDYFLQGK